MADIKIFLPKILKWEGGFVNDPVDPGGATNMGVTLSTWRNVGYDKTGDGLITAADIKLLTVTDVEMVLRLFYWNRWKADQIQNQSVAEILVDWVWASGLWGIIIPQQILGITPVGNVGPLTITTLNNSDQAKFHSTVYQARVDFIESLIVKNPKLLKFKKGWLNRLNGFVFCT
ncbi:MAG: glycosyl hydrolase 108 family protein [Bacteroidales bacterium]|jgi:lysozyme family protein